MQAIWHDKKKEDGKGKLRSGFQETGRDTGEDPSGDGMTKSRVKWGHYEENQPGIEENGKLAGKHMGSSIEIATIK